MTKSIVWIASDRTVNTHLQVCCSLDLGQQFAAVLLQLRALSSQVVIVRAQQLGLSQLAGLQLHFDKI